MKAIFALILVGTIGWGVALAPSFAPVGEAMPNVPPGEKWWEGGRTWDTGTGLRFAIDCATGEHYSWDMKTYKATGLRFPPTWPSGVIAKQP